MTASPRLAVALLAAVASALASARTSVVSSFPARGEVLAGSPTVVQFTFSEHVDPRSCRVKLASGAGKHFDADRPHADRNSPNTIVATVPVLRSGSYNARWVCTGPDGKRLRGDLAFSVK